MEVAMIARLNPMGVGMEGVALGTNNMPMPQQLEVLRAAPCGDGILAGTHKSLHRSLVRANQLRGLCDPPLPCLDTT